MVNRVLQAKALKLKKQLAKLPRPYEDVRFPYPWDDPFKPKSSGLIKVEVIESYRKRNKGLKYTPAEIEEIERNQRFKGVPPGRKEVLDTLAAYDDSKRRCITLFANFKLHVSLEYNPTRTEWRIIEFNKILSTFRASAIYPSKERAVHAYKHGIRWNK